MPRINLTQGLSGAVRRMAHKIAPQPAEIVSSASPLPTVGHA
jgi:hypothetical protein